LVTRGRPARLTQGAFSPRFCASCTAERDDLVAEVLDGRRVYLCPDCATGDLRSGRWTFAGGQDANGVMMPCTVHGTDGNHRMSARRG
jgi:hypothetical protein